MDNLISGDILKPISDLGIALLDKIENATGWIFSTSTAKKVGYKNIIEELSKREDINPIDRAILISNFRKIKREHKNKAQIVDKAIKLLDSDDKPQNIEDDWLLRFFDLCKNISDEQLQYVWARILANECKTSKSNSLKLLTTLSSLTKEEINIILKIAKNINYSTSNSVGIVYSNMDFLKEINISYEDFLNLEDMGIIKRETISFKDGDRVSFREKEFILRERKKSHLKLNKFIGMIRFTNIGTEILELSQVEKSEDVFNLFVKGISEEFDVIEK